LKSGNIYQSNNEEYCVVFNSISLRAIFTISTKFKSIFTIENYKESIMRNKFRTTALLVVSLIMISALLVGCSNTSAAAATTGTVSAISESSTVESSGNITAKQQTTLSWETSGIVGSVNVSTNDSVSKGDSLMTLDPSTAPSDVIAAQETLVSAKSALENAQQSNTSKASAEVALAKAQTAYNSALSNYWNRSATVGSAESIAVYKQKIIIQDNKIVELKTKLDQLAELPDTDSRKAQAKQDYNQAIIDRATLKRTLDGLQGTPDALDVQTLSSALDLAKANLEDAQRTYDAVKDGPSSDDIASAQAKVDAAQSTVNMLSITAPFDGEVVAIQTQVGDQVAEGTSAIILVNRSVLYIDVLIDETDISKLKIGDTAKITYSALPDLTSTGKVTFINPVGASNSGVVDYTVRVTLDNADPSILLGATATVDIETGAAATSLTVPVTAVQTDDTGEYVLRVKSDGTTERITVVSGTVSGTSVIVTSSDLKEGDTVELGTSTATTSSTQTSSSILNLGGNSGGPSGAPGGMPGQ
jgi:RND family efflux transporter MFP subunit